MRFIPSTFIMSWTLLVCHTPLLVSQEISGPPGSSPVAAGEKPPGPSTASQESPHSSQTNATDLATGFRGHFACRTFSGLNRELAIAVSDGDAGGIAQLLRAGADIDARSEGSHTRGMTILQMAIYHEWGIDSVRQVIGAGAKVAARDVLGDTALVYACRDSLGSNLDVVRELLGAGAKVDAKGAWGMTPLMHAVMHDESLQVVAALLDASANVAARDDRGWTALMHATRRRRENVKVMEMLVASGADVNAVHKHGGTALSHAAYQGHTQVVRFLIASGARVNAADDARWTPLICAAMNGHVQVVSNLVQSGANVHAKDRLGRSALALAQQHGHESVVKLLRKAGAK